MQTAPWRTRARSGLTLIEVVISTVVLGVFLASVFTAVFGSQVAFRENQVISRLRFRGQNALERLAELASQAVTMDPLFSPIKPATGVDSHGLRFRLIESVSLTGQPIYDDDDVVFILGADGGTEPCRGLVVGRGRDLPTIYAAAAGPDAILGTTDDDTSTLTAGGVPMLTLLIPATFAPRSGDLFTVDVSPAPVGRLLTFTLRLNARRRDGSFLFQGDVVLSERVALRQ